MTLAAIAAYNAGEGTVDEWVSTAGGLEVFDEGDIAVPRDARVRGRRDATTARRTASTTTHELGY